MLVKDGGLRYLAAANLDELTAIPGVGLAKATRIKAALELSARMALQSTDRPVIKSAEDVKNMVMEDMRYLDKEHFKAIYLDRKLRLLGIVKITEGGLFSAVVQPREVFKPAIQKSAASIILVHNHPSGDPTPSAEDIELTRRLREAGILLGIDVLDHIVIGDNKHCSLSTMGLMR
jgi:DNA repair protein RadC